MSEQDTTTQTVPAWFSDFLYNVAGFPQDSIPLTGPVMLTAYRWGCGMVPCAFQQVCPAPDIYNMAVSCAGASFLINWAADVPTAANPTYFGSLRKQCGIMDSQIGLLTSASDNGTGDSFQLPDWAKNASMQDLQWLKDPFGRQLLGLLQQFGALWGMS